MVIKRLIFRLEETEANDLLGDKVHYLATSVILFALWIILSGIFDTFHLVLGGLMSLLLAHFSWDLLFQNTKMSVSERIAEIFRFTRYIFWLLCQIVLANLHVARLVLDPKLPISPHIIHVPTRLKKDISFVAYANSITLTPGTITIGVERDHLLVHAIDDKVADDLLSGAMENRIGRVFESGGKT